MRNADGLFDADGRFRVEVVRETIEARLHLVPRFRQRLLRSQPPVLGRLWINTSPPL